MSRGKLVGGCPKLRLNRRLSFQAAHGNPTVSRSGALKDLQARGAMSTEPLRVLMVTARYLPDMGGTETHVHEVSRRLAQMKDFEITVLATDRTRSRPRREVIDNVTVLRVPAWPSDRDYYLAPGISRVVGQRNKWDLVHCQGIHNPVPVLAMMSAIHIHTPYLVTFHTGGHTLSHRNALRATQWRILGPLLRRAASLVAVSRFEADTMSAQAHLRGKSITIIRNGGTLPPPPPDTQVIPGRIVSCGRLERYKGHQRVIEALPDVIRRDPEAHLIIIGQGPYETELRCCAERAGVADRVEIKQLEPSDRQAMAIAMAEASVIAAMSDYEAHPVAVMEALSVGRPVVGYDTAGIGDLVAEGLVQGVPPGSSASRVAEQLLHVMPIPTPTVLPQLPTWDTSAEELGQLYLRTIGRQSRVAATNLTPSDGLSSESTRAGS
jgi:glycosyltransferase involved in cell wall biosynthesis